MLHAIDAINHILGVLGDQTMDFAISIWQMNCTTVLDNVLKFKFAYGIAEICLD
jgi:hypothetical protein